MPSGLRFVATVDEVQYNFSKKQWDLLRQKKLKGIDPLSYKLEQSLKGLISRKLFTKRNGSLVRTKLGDKVATAISNKTKEKV